MLTNNTWTFPGWCRCGHPPRTHGLRGKQEARRNPESCCAARQCVEDGVPLGDCPCPRFRRRTPRQVARYWWRAWLRGNDALWRSL